MAAPSCILINGPRGIGKTTAAETFVAHSPGTRRILPVIEAAKRVALSELHLDPDRYYDLFEMMKDVPMADLQGQTPREVYIAHAERQRKKYGPDYFAKTWQTRIRYIISQEPDVNCYVVPDVRFAPEFFAAMSVFTAKRVFLMRIKRFDKLVPSGNDWTGDVGSYFDTMPEVSWGHRELTYVNDLDVDFFRLETRVLMEGWLSRQR